MASTPLRQTLVHRLPKALILALAVALLGGGAIGFATAAGEDATTFAVPAPMGGDKAVYDIEPVDDWAQQGRIEVRPVAPLVLGDGSVVSAYGLRRGKDTASISINDFTQVIVGWSEAFVDATTGDVVAKAQARGGGATSSSSALDPIGGTSESSLTASALRSYGPDTVPCATRSSLQGHPVAIDGGVRVEGCGEDGATLTFHSLGLQDLQGHESLVLESQDLAMRLWYQAGIPYPVLYVYDAGTPQEERWRMVGFTPGDQPLVAGPVPPPVQLPAIELAATGPYGPALAGFQHPYTIEQAVQEAQARSEAVADFVAAHPDWFVRSSEYRQDQKDGVVQGHWSLTLRGGPDEIRVSVDQPAPGENRAPAELERAITSLPLDQSSMGSVMVYDAAFPEPEWPAACLPSTLPTIDSVARHWAALERRAASDANSYGFSLDCFGLDDAVEPRAVVTAGDSRFVHPDSPGLVPQDSSESYPQLLTMLVVSGDGQDVELETSDVVVTRESWGAKGDPASQDDGTAIQRSDVGAWAVPSTPVAASITIVSILAGIAYWLWPAVKGGSFGLFSRLQAPDLLDHPLRKELSQRIEAQPGVHYQDLVRAMGKGKGTIEHHLRKLQEGGLVKSIAAGGYTCFFPTAFDRRMTAAAPALKSEGARKVLAAIRANPGASAMQVGAVTGLSPAAINHHLQRLGAAGLVDILRNGRSLSLQPTALASQVGDGAAAGA